MLRHASRQEERKQLELTTLAEEERRLREQLSQLRDKEQQQLRALPDRSRDGAIDPADLGAAVAYLGSIEGSIAEQMDVVSEVETRVLESREQLIEILREKQSLEKLKQRQADEAAAEEKHREAKSADEMTAARFQRRAQEA